MTTLRDIASFIRWRLVPVRYVTRVTGMATSRAVRRKWPSRSAISEAIERDGYHEGPRFSAPLMSEIRARYLPRGKAVVPKARGAPFINLLTAEDIRPDDAVMKLAFSPEVLDAAADYFGGSLTLDSVQVLYSWPTEGPLRESQKWHKDYGDSRSFHCIIYVNDVVEPDHGPFVFVGKVDTRRIKKVPIIRRVADDQFARELANGKVRQFFGIEGSSVFVDPAVCYHYGSRCKTPRLAIFVTFNSSRPFVPPTDLVLQNPERWLKTARAIRPDLGEDFLHSLLSLPAA